MEMINGKLLKDMLASGANNLSNKFTEIDALNVFPVPDGDTGTNLGGAKGRDQPSERIPGARRRHGNEHVADV